MTPIRRVATVLVFVGIGLYVWIFAKRKYNRLFFYSLSPAGFRFGKAAVATIGPDHFATETEFNYGDWSNVSSAASGENKWLFFQDFSDGSAATVLIDDNFIPRLSKYYPPGQLGLLYTYVIVDGRGYLMLVVLPQSGKKAIGFGQVLDDGTFVEWWRTDLPDLPLPYATKPVGLKRAHAWYVNDDPPGGGSTVYVFDVKHAQIVSSRHWDAPLDGIIADEDIIFLYFHDGLKTTEICVLDGNQQLVTVKRTEFDFDFYTVPFDRVVGTPGAHLFYTYSSIGAAGAIRALGRGGFPLTHRTEKMDWTWHYVVEC